MRAGSRNDLRLGPAISEFDSSPNVTPEGRQKRTAYWARFGLRDTRMTSESDIGILMPEDETREVVRAVKQPGHVLIDTIELQPAVPRKTEGDPTRVGSTTTPTTERSTPIRIRPGVACATTCLATATTSRAR